MSKSCRITAPKQQHLQKTKVSNVSVVRQHEAAIEE
jgi:hypothetical protein